VLGHCSVAIRAREIFEFVNCRVRVCVYVDDVFICRVI